MRRASSFLRYTVLEQLDAYTIEGTNRVLTGFDRMAEEANEYAERMYESYVSEVASEGADPADYAEEALEQGGAYYGLLAELKQAVLNLWAVGLYHLYEQHRDRLTALLAERSGSLPTLESHPSWPKIHELRLVANTVKHAEGSSARQLRELRPDLFAPVAMSDELMAFQLRRPRELPLAGQDLFVREKDIEGYRDSIRALWEWVGTLI